MGRGWVALSLSRALRRAPGLRQRELTCCCGETTRSHETRGRPTCPSVSITSCSSRIAPIWQRGTACNLACQRDDIHGGVAEIRADPRAECAGLGWQSVQDRGRKRIVNWLNPIIPTICLTDLSKTLQMCRPTDCCLRSTEPVFTKRQRQCPPSAGLRQREETGRLSDGGKEVQCARAGWRRANGVVCSPAVGPGIPGPAGPNSCDWLRCARQPVCVCGALPSSTFGACEKKPPKTSPTFLAFLSEPSNLLTSAQFSSLDLSCNVSSLSPSPSPCSTRFEITAR